MFHGSMQFDLGEDVNALRDMVHAWAQERVKPLAQKIDQENAFPNALWREMGELGLLGVTVTKNTVVLAWDIWPTPLLWKRSRVRLPLFHSATGHIPTCV